MSELVQVTSAETTVYVRSDALSSADTAALAALDALVSALEADVAAYGQGIEGGTW